MKYHNRDQFLDVMKKMAAESQLEQNVTTSGTQPSPPPKKEGPATQQASPPSILMEGVNDQSVTGLQQETRPAVVQPDEMKPTSSFKFRGPDESMSRDAEERAKADASGSLGLDFENFVEGKRKTQAELKSLLDNYGSQSAASSEQAKISAAREFGFLDELQKIAVSAKLVSRAQAAARKAGRGESAWALGAKAKAINEGKRFSVVTGNLPTESKSLTGKRFRLAEEEAARRAKGSSAQSSVRPEPSRRMESSFEPPRSGKPLYGDPGDYQSQFGMLENPPL